MSLKTLTDYLPLIEWGFISLLAIIASYVNLRFFIKNQSEFNVDVKEDIKLLKEAHKVLKEDIVAKERKATEDYERVQKEMALRDSKMTDFIDSMREFKSDIKISIQDIKSKIHHAVESFNNTNSGIRQLLESQEKDIQNLEKEQKEMFKELRVDLKNKQDKQ